MANVNIFDKYGIKEVANVYFEALEDDLAAGVYKGDIVLFLDTLKVSTIETTAENTPATGGWGNPKLVQWDYGKEINITLEDALLSLESLRFMLGGAIHKPETGRNVIVRHTEEVVCEENGVVPLPKDHLTNETLHPKAWKGHNVRLINLGGGTKQDGTPSDGTGLRTQLTSDSSNPVAIIDGTKAINFVNPKLNNGSSANVSTAQGDHIRIFWDEEITTARTDETAVEVTISPDTFPGTYKVVGDTFMRSEKTGKDEPFQFVINKAKVQSNVTFTLQAEGDPSTFEMTLNVLRSKNEKGEDEMMKLVRYSIESSSTSGNGNDIGSVVGS